MITNKLSMTPALYNEACRLMSLGYSPRHAAYVVNIQVSQLAKTITGQGDDDGIETLERECRITRVKRIKAHIAAYPSTPMWPAQEVAA
jgi:hypothetical protein